MTTSINAYQQEIKNYLRALLAEKLTAPEADSVCEAFFRQFSGRVMTFPGRPVPVPFHRSPHLSPASERYPITEAEQIANLIQLTAKQLDVDIGTAALIIDDRCKDAFLAFVHDAPLENHDWLQMMLVASAAKKRVQGIFP